MNWYAFVNGNPMSGVDPSGLCGTASPSSPPIPRVTENYRIANSDSIIGRNLVGVFITSEQIYNGMVSASTETKRESVSLGSLCETGIAELNQRLEPKGQAIEIIVVANISGYMNYIKDTGKSDIQYPYIAFHGSGSRRYPFVKLGGYSAPSMLSHLAKMIEA